MNYYGLFSCIIKTSIFVNQIKIFVGDNEVNDYRHKYIYSTEQQAI